MLTLLAAMQFYSIGTVISDWYKFCIGTNLATLISCTIFAKSCLFSHWILNIAAWQFWLRKLSQLVLPGLNRADQ